MPIYILFVVYSILLLSNIYLLVSQQKLPPSKDPTAISHFLVAISILFRNKKSAFLPFFIQNSFFRERENPSCLCISFLSPLYRSQSSSRYLGVCIALHSLKHLPSLSFPIIFKKDLKQPFQLKESQLQLFRISILRGFKRKEIVSFIDPSIVFSFIFVYLLIIFSLFQYLFSCYSPYVG